MGSMGVTSTVSSASGSPTAGLAPHVILASEPAGPTLFGMPLKYVSLLTLALQNAFLTIIMHYSRVSTPPSRTYSAASAVLVNELLKGSISLGIALARIDADMSRTSSPTSFPYDIPGVPSTPLAKSKKLSIQGLNGGPPVFAGSGGRFTFSRAVYLVSPARWMSRLRRLRREVFSSDCWKLSIPAILYVIQNNLQFVAAANLDVATFQVTYQMKILSTAAFSVLMLNRRLSATRWLALLFLAIGVGIVQIQSGAGHSSPAPPSTSEREVPNVGDVIAPHTHTMHPLTGFLAVCAACMTSGLAGVYFEMVLKNSQADLWVRNVQLSLFSLVPALVPVFFTSHAGYPGGGWLPRLFRNFTPWAWATVLTQVAGGLVTAIVIKQADNILKGFATSLSIILSFLASVALFGFSITPAFVVGASTVLASTWMYNQPSKDGDLSIAGVGLSLLGPSPAVSRRSSFPGSPVGPDAPILGHPQVPKQRSPYTSPSSLVLALGLTSASASRPASTLPSPMDGAHTPYFPPAYPPPSPSYHSPPSRPPSRPPSGPPTRPPSRPPSTRPSSTDEDPLQTVDLGAGPQDAGRLAPPPLAPLAPLAGDGVEPTKLVRR